MWFELQPEGLHPEQSKLAIAMDDEDNIDDQSMVNDQNYLTNCNRRNFRVGVIFALFAFVFSAKITLR